MKQVVGAKLLRKCIAVTGVPYVVGYASAKRPHGVIECWYVSKDGVRRNADVVNHRTGTARAYIRNGDYASIR